MKVIEWFNIFILGNISFRIRASKLWLWSIISVLKTLQKCWFIRPQSLFHYIKSRDSCYICLGGWSCSSCMTPKLTFINTYHLKTFQPPRDWIKPLLPYEVSQNWLKTKIHELPMIHAVLIKYSTWCRLSFFSVGKL